MVLCSWKVCDLKTFCEVYDRKKDLKQCGKTKITREELKEYQWALTEQKIQTRTCLSFHLFVILAEWNKLNDFLENSVLNYTSEVKKNRLIFLCFLGVFEYPCLEAAKK